MIVIGNNLSYFTSGKTYPINNLNLSLVNFGIQMSDPRHSQGPTIKTEHVLQYVYNGRGTLIIAGKSFEVSKGDLFYLPKNVVVTYFSDCNNPYEYYWLGVDGASAKSLINGIGLNESSPVKRIENEEIITNFEHLRRSVEKNSLSGFIEANSYMFKLVSLFLSTEEENNKILKNVSVESVNKAVYFIQSNFGKDINVTEISEAVGLNRNYFCGLFKKYTGSSPVDYLMSYRINQAKLMLANGMRVTETAISCGFNSPSNFGSQFKKSVGVTPSSYRKCTFDTTNKYINS